MANNTDDDGLTLLENAYSLSDPASNTNYYNRLADTYDADFAQGLGYISPDQLHKRLKRNPQITIFLSWILAAEPG